MALKPIENYDRYPQLQGELFRAVQHQGIFDDSKTFVDSIPNADRKALNDLFREIRGNESFDLQSFIEAHFDIAEDVTAGVKQPLADSMEEHIQLLWEHLTSDPFEEQHTLSTLVTLPNRYIKPGGRFREIYYWDSYFTAEGLVRSDMLAMVEDMIDNFAYLIDEFGFVPNGNRVYYLSRSQPPYFCQLLQLLERERGANAALEYLPQLEAEYEFWMDGKRDVTPMAPTHRRVVSLPDGAVLNRYWDDFPRPRAEMYREDIEVAEELPPGERKRLFRDIRAAAESGWDFSSRWFDGGDSLASVRTTELLPVDLNSLLYDMETNLAEWCRAEHREDDAEYYEQAALQRKVAIQTYCWDDDAGYYFDYAWTDGEHSEEWTLAGVLPLFVGLASEEQAAAVAETLREKFLFEGGLATTLTDTGQQWDYPAGWAPLIWLAVRGLDRYGHVELAETITERWLRLNRAVFQEEGYMMEKYNVVDATVTANVGEYTPQAGFGWTNGVTLGLQEYLHDA